MILFIGSLADEVIAHQVMLLNENGADFLILDPRNLGERWDLSWQWNEPGISGVLCVQDRQVPLDQVNAIWFHHLMDDTPAENDLRDLGSRHSFLADFADAFPGLVVNRPCRAASNASKPYQQQIINRCGFHPIRTLITTDPGAARSFYDQCRGQVIYKSLSWIRSRVCRLGPADLDRLESLRNCPTQFQEYVPGRDVRVHVAGKRLFATEIEADGDDYRFLPQGGSRRMRAVELPPEIAARCLELSETLELPVCGIDLRRLPGAEYCCFEVNPIPGYTFYQRQTGQPIGEAIADLLCRAARYED